MTLPPSSIDLRPHELSVALLQPQIAPNAGNIGRLCVATGTRLHLVRPMGFVLSDKALRRSAMDYWPRLQVQVHDDTDAFVQAMAGRRIWLFTSKAKRSLWEADFADGDSLWFGSETHGLPAALIERHAGQSIRIPQSRGERCLNVSTAVGIGLYEALRQIRG
ncbi:MAG TPA: tRNA (cytidine(34)-2'-O)-methyltransferase [Rhizomicrobium sp.]|nr:tRNA (cytidine(34)-2'-O)-methyltransferase [Rhizomicrobium sp.]